MNNSARLIAILLAGTCLFGARPAVASLRLIKASLGAGLWSQSPTGTIYTNDNRQGNALDLKNDLKLTSNTRAYIWFEVAPPLPAIPNIRLEYSSISTSGNAILTHGVTYAGTTYTTNIPLHSQFNLTQGDVILYYQPLTTVPHVSLGLDIKALSIDTRFNTDTISSSANTEVVVPMLYARLGVNLPLTGLSAFVDGSYYRDGSSSLSDYKLRLAYTSSLGIGLEVGYRQAEARLAPGYHLLEFRFGNSSIQPNGNVRAGGAYLGVFYDF